MDMFLQQLVNALSLGGTYALLALGLAVVFSIMGLINFAHGELMTAAGYGLCFALLFGLPFGLATVLAMAVAIALVLLMERTAFRPVRGASGTTLLLTSFAVSAILRVLFQNFISARPKPVPMPMSLSGTIEIGGLNIGVIQAISILVTVIMLVGLNLFLRTTVLGRAMRAAAEDFAIVRLMGIRANAVVATAFAISGLLAGVAGILWVAQRGSVDPLMGFLPVLKAFIAAIIGGLGSLSGAVAGGFLLGFIEVFLQAYLPENLISYRDAFTILLVIAVLLFAPQGLLARKTIVKL
ncbi:MULTISPECIES: branched-chain amino acid ABC transporter permease [Hyphomicrobiales]|uniref:Inner-membrane translocator n=1 Tax=Brucella anthropi (strain ATCC 49188 / DSM 6882 / CCUG 24695 / JCM 21032 / LMG 3331 / NBRC 15819 / NCTC 12168 / Alc 37) TaxID=439375 RepID=A6X7H7_BRUA4|nr:branched-chain amino acid ABC transporter permease [Brucella anthropi]ABS17181.1 inner-membrane translocator [Brucella anthropi ATCC 49188]SUB55879.1 LIV-I protein H [Brucella anthropi]